MPDFITTGRIKSINQQQYTPSQTKTDRIASMLGPVNTTVTTSTGKQYTLNDKQVGWIQNRYKSKMADTYGYDDADQLAKRNGQLSAAALKTYKNTNVDRQLAELGLPSEKELGKYLEDYSRWHTGGMDQVFGQMNLPKDYWTKTKGFYQADMQKAYENTAEDQQRKARGLMPSKWEEKYTDTEIDEQLRARGLPPLSEFGTYAERWDNYQGIENFYANVARNETNLRLAGIKDDDTVYPYNGEEYKGKDLYAMAFYDELDKVNDDGSFVYGSIRPLFKNSSTKETTPTGDYLYDRGAAVLADNKNAVDPNDYASYNAFSYDDYKKRYDELYQRYFANQKTQSGQLVSDALAVQARDADEEATKEYYDVDNSWFGEAKKGIKQLVDQYQQDYPQNTFYDMFSDMLKNNVSLTNVRKAAKALQGETKTNGAFNEISEALVKAENDWAHTEELDAMYGVNGYDVVEGRVIPKGATPVEGEAAPEPAADTKTFFNFGDAYANAAKGYDTSAEAARAEQKALRNQQRVANRTLASEQVDEDLLKQTKDAIAIYDSAVAAYEDTAGNGAPSAASREPINKANELLNQLGYKSIYGARRYVESIENGEQESEQLKKDVTDAINELDDAKADASLKGDEKSLQAVVDAEKKVTSLLNVGSADEAREWLRTGEFPASEATFNGTAVTVDNAIRVVETYMEQNGGWNAKVAQQAFNELYRIGVSPDIIAQTAAEMQDRFGEMEETFTEPEKPDAPGIDSMREYVEANKDRGTDEATVNDTKKALERLLFDEEGNNIVLTNADSVINAIETVRKMPFTTPAAVDEALKQLGFSANGWFSGVAEDLTNGWSTDEMVNLRLALGRERAVDVDPEDNLPDDAKFVRDTFGLSDFWTGDPVSSSQKILRQDDFALALEWANQQIANGTLSAGQAYNILAEDGYHDELEILMGDDWHKAHFKEYVAPGLWNMSKEEDRLLWDEMSEAERDAATELMWEKLSDEDKEAKYGDPSWWKYDPSVKRTAAQAWGQQAAAILPGLISQLISTPVKIADSVDALITGRPETWGFTDKLNNIQNAVSSYGSVDEFSLGTRSAEWITSAAQELLKMETLGSVGNLAGEIFSGTGVGSKIIKSAASNSKVVSKAASFVMEMIKASPYVAESYADHYIDAKLRGATNGEAAFYGLTLGGAEGAFEWANFDKLWGKALGSDKFVKEIIQGGLDYANMGINGKLLLSSLALSSAGEATEEFAGYNLETLEKLVLFSGNGLGEKLGLTPWANGTEYSLREGLEQAFVGGLIGLLGAGLHSGSLTTRHLIMDYAIDNGDAETFRKVAPDIAYSIGIAESLSKSDLDMYKQGGANIMSSTAYGETLTQIANLDEGIENAGKALEDELSNLQLKRETQLREIDKKAAKGFAVDLDKANPKEALDVLAKKCNELGVDIHDIDLAKFISGGMTEQESEATKALLSQRSQEAVQRNKAAVQKDYDAAVAYEQGKYQATVKQDQNLLDGLTKQVQGHWVGIYLQNYNGIISGMTDEMVSNLAQAYQNGAKYEPADLTGAAAEGVANEQRAETARSVDAGRPAVYNNMTAQEETTNGRTGEEATPGGDAGVSGQAVAVDNQGGQRRWELGRRNPGVLESVSVKEKLNNIGADVVEMNDADTQPFYDAIGAAKQANPYGAFVTQHETEEYDGMKKYLSADGGVGVAVTEDGNIVSVFKNPDVNTGKGSVSSILFTALENGGKKLDNFNSKKLSQLYLQHGFVPVARIAFNDDYAPDGWNYERDGRPDILFWVHNGDSADTILDKMGSYKMPDVDSLPLFEGDDAYDKAAAYRDGLVNESTGWTAQQASNTRSLTDEEVAKVQQAVKDIKYNGDVVFIDDPNEESAWIDDNGTITINRANISETEAKELADNPGWWLLTHELAHFTEGTAEYEEYSGIVKRIMQRRFGDNYMTVLNEIKNDYAQRGKTLDNPGAERELVAKFMQSGELLNNAESIETLVREQGNLADRIYNWIRYKIQDLKLRREPNSALARDLLKAERLYAQAYRKANRKAPLNSNTDRTGDDARKNSDTRYSTGQSWDELLQKYGSQPQGRTPRASDERVPNRVDDDTRVSRLGRSLYESPHMTDDMRAEARDMMVNQNWLSYTPTTNEESMAEARNFIAARQPLAAQQEFHDMVMQGKYGRKTNAIGLQLLADASNRGDVDSFYSIANDLQIAATEAGQSAQIFNVLKELKGVGSAYYMQRVIERLNSKYDDLIQKGKMQRITVSPVLMEQLSQARTVDQITEAEEAVAKEISAQVPLTWADRLSAWRYFSMLGNPTTHIRNMTGNLLMKGLNTVKDAVATGVESISNIDQSQRAHAMLTAADKSMWGDFAEESYNEQARNLSGGGKLGFETFVKQNTRSFDTKWLNALAKFNFNALEGEDLMFIRPAYKNALMQYMKAQGYTLNEKGQAGKVDAKGVFHEMTNAQRTAAVEWASEQAWKQTFRDASSLATMLNKLSKEGPIARLLVEGVMPFKKTPINIAKRGLEYSPAGIVMGVTQLATKVKQGKMSAATAIDNLSSGITGTALMALGVFLAKAGLIRAGGEKDKKLETYLEDTGDQTYAVKFGDKSINMSSIAPATIPLFMGVALQEMLSRNGEDEGVDLSTITDVLAGTLNPFMEMSFMSSLNSALKNYNNEGIGGALGSTIMTAAQNYGSQYLPTLGGKVAQFIDPTQRTTKSSATSPVGGNMDYYWRSLVKKVPGAEATLQPDVNIWGQTTTKDSFGDWALDFANKFILPTNVKVTNRDAVDNELIRVVESTGNVDFLPSDGAKYFKVKGETYKMNASQYTQYSQERGQAAYAALKDTMASASYRNASDEQKADMLKKAIDAAYKQVNNQWKEKLGAYDNK